jgi:hypothetical protein
MTADDFEGLGAAKRRVNRLRGGSDGPGDELAQRAVVFLMDAWTLGFAMIFRVWTYRGNDSAARVGCVDDADDARQRCLHQRASENPPTDKSRNASTHSVVSCDRAARRI